MTTTTTKTKTVLLIPCFNSSLIWDRFVESLRRLDPQPDRYIFLENNSTDGTFDLIRNTELPAPKEIIKVHFAEDAVQRSETVYDCIAHIRQLLLTRARHLNPDFAIFLDDDIVVDDHDMIHTLTLWNGDIVGGSYMRMFDIGMHLAARFASPIEGKVRMYKKVKGALMFPLMTAAGCMCLRRKVIQDRRLNFFPITKSDIEGDVASEDFGFCRSAKRLGYEILLDGLVSLSHWSAINNRLIKPWTFEDGKAFKY